MNAVAPAPLAEPAGTAPLRALLDRHARRLQLVAAQLEALEHGDAARFRALAEEREALEREALEREAAPEDGVGDDDGDGLPGVDEVLREALERIEREWAAEQEARAGLDALRDTSLPRVRHLGGSVRMAGSYRELAPRDARFSVRF